MAKTCQPGEGSFDYQRLSSSTKPRLDWAIVTTSKVMPWATGRLSRRFARVALVRRSQFRALAGGLLDPYGEFTYLSAFLFVGG